MSNKKIISVVGYANISYFSTFMQEKLHNLAYELGKAIIDSNYILASGGLRGIMESCSQGARDSKKYTQGSIIGLLPNYDKSIANQYVDIALPLGFDIGRNISVASVCDAMIIVGGGAGSLSEAALAWQLKKPIIAITLDSKNIQSASDMLANKRLDNRRSDKIYEAKNVKEAIKILKQNLQSYKDKTFKCIESKIGENEAKEKLQNLFNTNLKILGSGSEGYVFSDNKNVYKIFSNPSLKLYLNLLSLSNNLESNEFFPHFNVLFKEGNLVIYYPYFKSINLLNLKYKLPKQSFIDMLNMMYFAGVIHTDLQPKNILVKKKDELFMCDIGADLISYSKDLFESMVRRAFGIYKLQDKLNEINIKDFLSPLNTKEDFSLLESFLDSKDLKSEYKKFLHSVGSFATYKYLILDFYKDKKDIKTIFDYGSGSGSIAKNLTLKLNKKVIAYDIDSKIIESNKANYEILQDYFYDYKKMQDLIDKNIKFDSVLCSLVLCVKLANTQQESKKVIESILKDLINLAKNHILILICNPLFFNAKSNIQEKILPKNVIYSNDLIIKKKMFSTQNERIDFHFPLSFYENLFYKFNLKIANITQSGDTKNNAFKVQNADFLMFSLYKDSKGNEK